MNGLAGSWALRAPSDVCAFVDDLDGTATGEIAVRGTNEPLGSIFVDQGRICWAAARGLARRLSELLAKRAGLAPAAMEAHFLDCKMQRTPLGEHLVGRGVLSAEELREALLTHTVESLVVLARSDARSTWTPRAGTTYNPRFTFGTAELLAEIGGLAHPNVAASVRPLLHTLFDAGEWAVAFVRDSGSASPRPVAIQGPVPPAAAILARFGKWGASILDVTGSFTDEAALFAVSRGSGDKASSLVVFRHAGSFVVGETGVHGPARILNRRARERRQRSSTHADLRSR